MREQRCKVSLSKFKIVTVDPPPPPPSIIYIDLGLENKQQCLGAVLTSSEKSVPHQQINLSTVKSLYHFDKHFDLSQLPRKGDKYQVLC